jgi:carboxypeptidase family protein
MKKIFIFLFLTLTMGLICQSDLFAQETSGTLTGKVTDSSGHALPGATVTALHQPSGTKYTTVSSASGLYNLPNLRIGGPYKIQVSFAGMVTQMRDDITVTLGEPQTQSFALADKNLLEGVTVKGARAGVKANAYGAGMNISRDQVRNMPTVSRSIQDVTRLVPQGSKDNSFAGTSFRYNNVTIDGAINNDAIGFSPSLGGITGSSGMPGSSTRSNSISMDAIEDMQVYLAPYDVKIGNFTGGSINAVTRSGTNTVTGSVYGYGRNAAITGSDKAGTEGAMPSAFHDYQTGVRVGFPLIPNKLFFFTNEELARRVDVIQQGAGTAESAGILSVSDAKAIRDTTLNRYGWDPGAYGSYNIYANSNKYFNRLDWNINSRHQLSIRNNTITSEAVNLERDQQDFRFGSIAYRQVNNQHSTVAEWKSRWNNQISNSLVAGYTAIHDYREPFSDPALPQVQIQGNTPGSTIFLGTDREAAIFDQKQHTIEISDNLTWNLGKHKFLFGTHNELYDITYNFVNSWNGRVDYLSVGDYLNSNPYRVRASYNYTENSRTYILSHPSAAFKVDLFSVYVQDEIQISDRFRLTPGLRADETIVPHKQTLSSKTQEAYTDPYFNNTYSYTPLNRITGDYFSKIQISPRLGFRYDLKKDKSLVLRGGAGMFTGRIPFAWLGYAFYNNGDTYGAYDQKADGKAFLPGTDPLRRNPNGISDFISSNGVLTNSKNAGPTQVDVLNNHFVMPKVLRSSMALDYMTRNQYKFSIEAIVTKTIRDVLFQQVNTVDNPTYYGYDLNHRQPIFPSGGIDPRFTNAYELSNTDQGYRYSITGTVSRNYQVGLGFMAAYTYGRSEDVSNGIRNSMESNWQLNQSLNPNNPGLALSNFDIRHRIVVNVNYRKSWNNVWVSTFSVFLSAQSGSPFTYGFVNNSVQGTGQQVSLAYIPKKGETINFFQDYSDNNGNMVTASSQAQAFDKYIDGNNYLSGKRGDFTERNAAHTPWNTQADFHFGQEIHFSKKAGGQFVTITADVMNLTNLLNSGWGRVYFVPNTYNSTASVGLTPSLFPSGQNAGNYPVYTFSNPGNPYSIDFLSSRYQMQLGLRYSF